MSESHTEPAGVQLLISIEDNGNGDYPTLVRNEGNVVDAVNLGHSGPNLVINGTAFVLPRRSISPATGSRRAIFVLLR